MSAVSVAQEAPKKHSAAHDNLYEAQVLIRDAEEALSVMTALLCDYQDGIQLPSNGLRVLLLPVEESIRNARRMVMLAKRAL